MHLDNYGDKYNELMAVLARKDINPWKNGSETLKALPESGILDNSIVFKLPKLLPRNQTVRIETITPSDVYVCQLENKGGWNEETLLSDPYLFEKNENEKVITSIGDLSIFHKKIMEDAPSLTLPKTQKMSSVVIFIKENSQQNDNAKTVMYDRLISHDVIMDEVG